MQKKHLSLLTTRGSNSAEIWNLHIENGVKPVQFDMQRQRNFVSQNRITQCKERRNGQKGMKNNVR